MKLFEINRNNRSILQEGGNVFKEYRSEPILRENIKPTLKEFFRELTRIFPKASNYFKDVKTLGSTGKKDVSGDIDLALPGESLKNIEDWNIDEADIKELFIQFKRRARTSTDAMILKKACIELIARQIEHSSSLISVDTKQSGSGTLFTQFPQYNSSATQIGKYVQIDINIGNLEWLTFSYYSDGYSDGICKGLHRTQLLIALFAEQGLVFNHNYGVKEKSTGKIVATTPKEALNLLNRLYGFNLPFEILPNFYKLQEFLEKNLTRSKLDQVYDRYLKILDSTRCDIPPTLRNYWLDNQERLGLTGKFLPATSVLYPFREE